MFEEAQSWKILSNKQNDKASHFKTICKIKKTKVRLLL